MKLPERKDIEVISNFEGKTTALSIEAVAMPKLMTIVTELYPKPIYAAVREYSSNAWDSHVEAGQKRPIEVSLPSLYNEVLKIQDWGVGMSEDDLHETYSMYGKSTKEHTNDQNGMLGLGSKSALAYCAQFTITAVKDGEKTVASMSRTGTGGGDLKTIHKEATTEENGVEVAIPCRAGDIYSFEKEAKRLFKYWNPDDVLVNGHKPERVKGLQVTDNILLREIGSSYEAGYDPNSVVVMGGIPYKTDFDFGINDKYAVIAFVNIGDVEPSPDRESLKETPEVFETLEKIKKACVDGLSKSIKKDVNAAKTRWDAAKALAKHKNLVDLREAGIKYKGKEIPVDVEVGNTYSNYEAYRIGDHSSRTYLHVSDYHDALIVTGWDIKFNVTHKKKAVKYIDEYGSVDDKGHSKIEPRQIVFLNELPDKLKPWIDPEKIVKWEDLRKIKLPTQRNSQLAAAGTYDIVTPDATYLVNTLATDIDDSKPLFFKTSKRWSSSDTTILNRFHKKGWSCVYVAGNRSKKFQRLFPTAKELQPEINRLRDKVKNSLTSEERQFLAIANKAGTLCELDETKIKDTVLKKHIRLAKKRDKYQELRNLMRQFYHDEVVKPINPLDKYPLIVNLREHGIGDRTKEHAYIYINAVHGSTT